MEDEAPEVDDDELEEWMRIQQPPRLGEDPIQVFEGDDADDHLQYWHQDDNHYTQLERERMGTWLLEEKRAEVNRELEIDPVDIRMLNRQQQFAYNIVSEHLTTQNQLLMRIEGFAGSFCYHITFLFNFNVQERFTLPSYLIIDEYSMVGLRMLCRIDRRLRQATGHLQEPFGGVNILLVGDIL